MPITVEAIYENGLLKLSQPLPLREGAAVRVTIHTEPNRVSQTYGMIGWRGDAETLERLATSPEFDPQEEEP
jgi:predicted DNA-binding antitoxin AbrB/MazE fold protein